MVLLSKRLGTGIALSAVSMGVVDESGIQDHYASMRLSNARSSHALGAIARTGSGKVRAVTDVSGFGLFAAVRQCVRDREVEVWLRSLPLFESTRGFVRNGAWPPLADDNLSVAGTYADFVGPFHDGFVDQLVAASPETSGGLLAVLDPAAARSLTEFDTELDWWTIGRVGSPSGRIIVTDTRSDDS